MADKELIVRAKVDTTSFRQLQQLVEGMARPLKSLAADVQRAQTMLGSLAGTGGAMGTQRGMAPSLGGIVSQVMQRGIQNQGAELTRSVNVARQAMGSLVNVVRKDARTLKDAFAEIDKAAARTADRLNLARRDMGTPDRMHAGAWPVAGVAGPGAITGVAQQLRQAAGQPAAAGGPGAPLPPAGPPGGPGAPGQPPAPPQRTTGEAMAIGAAVAAALARSAGGAMGLMQTYKTAELGMVGDTIQATRGRWIGQMLRGVPEDALAMKMLMGREGYGAESEVIKAGGQGLMKGQSVANLIGDVASVIATGRGLKSGGGGANAAGTGNIIGGIGSSVVNAAGEVMKWDNQYFRAAEMQNQMAALDALKRANPMWQYGVRQLEGMGQYAQAERMLGGQSLGFRNLGWGYSLSETLGAAQAQQQMTGLGGVRDLTRAGLRGGAAGMDLGIYQGALSGLFMATGGARKGSAEAIKILEEGVARGTVKGWSDPRTSQEMASAIGQAAKGQVGVTSEGVNALVAFLGAGAKGPLSVGEAQARRNTLDVMHGQTGIDQGMRLLMASKALPGRSPYQWGMLASESPTSILMGGAQYGAKGFNMNAAARARFLQQQVMWEMRKAGTLGQLTPEEMRDPESLAYKGLLGTKRYGTSPQQALESAKMFIGLSDMLAGGDVSDESLKRLVAKTFKNRGGVGAKVVGVGEAAHAEVDRITGEAARQFTKEDVVEAMKSYAETERSARNMDLSNQMGTKGSRGDPMYVILMTEEQAAREKAKTADAAARKKVFDTGGVSESTFDLMSTRKPHGKPSIPKMDPAIQKLMEEGG